MSCERVPLQVLFGGLYVSTNCRMSVGIGRMWWLVSLLHVGGKPTAEDDRGLGLHSRRLQFGGKGGKGFMGNFWHVVASTLYF